MIYTRIDTYSVILYNVSISDILSHFSIDLSLLDESYKKSYEKNDCKIGDTFVFSFCGIRLECRLQEFNYKTDDIDNSKIIENVLHVNWQWIRLYLSSEGLDFIQNVSDNLNLDVHYDTAFCQADFWLPITEDYKITRCDFAFDYVNYEGNEFERFRKIIATAEFDDNLTSNGRLYTGVTSGISYSYRGGKDKTIYLGSTGSDRMLRIYDKKYQLCDELGNWDSSKIPKTILQQEIEINSWYRVELQTRENFAARYLYSCCGDFRYIMGEISSFFDVRTKEGKTIPPLHKIFLWTKRTPIIQNANSNKPRTEIQVVSEWVTSIARTNILLLVGCYGWEDTRRLINNSISNIMKNAPLKKKHAFISSFNNRISVIAKQEGLKFDENGNIGDLIKADDGAFYLAPFPRPERELGPYSIKKES